MLPLRHGNRGAPKVPDDNACCVISLIVRSSQQSQQSNISMCQRLQFVRAVWVSISNNTKSVATEPYACAGSAPDWLCFSGSGVGSGVGEEDSYHSISTAFTKTTFALSVMA